MVRFHLPMKQFGQLIKEQREALSWKHEDMFEKTRCSAAFIARLEKGYFRPPYGEQLEKLLEAMEVRRGSPLWFELCDLSDIQRGELPSIVDKEKNPELFQKMREIYREAYLYVSNQLKYSHEKSLKESLEGRRIPKKVSENPKAMEKLWDALQEVRMACICG